MKKNSQEQISFGARVRLAREKKGLNGRDFAKILGISQAYLSQLERGTRSNPSGDLLKKIAGELGMDVPWLLNGGEARPTPPRETMVGDTNDRLTDETRKGQSGHVDGVKRAVLGLMDAMRYVDEKRRARYLNNVAELMQEYASWCEAARPGAMMVAGEDQRKKEAGEKE